MKDRKEIGAGSVKRLTYDDSGDKKARCINRTVRDLSKTRNIQKGQIELKSLMFTSVQVIIAIWKGGIKRS